MERKKRRSSQVFNFEQTEEALEENQVLKDLYQNKNFVSPDPGELETIIEEGVGKKEEHRTRRGTPNVSDDGGLILGMGKAKRTIEGYKFWKQDDKERIRKRKTMMAKQWKGRKRQKTYILDLDGEKKLQVLIDTREESESEEEQRRDEECKRRLQAEKNGEKSGQILCVWGKEGEGSGSSIEDVEGCIWSSHLTNHVQPSSKQKIPRDINSKKVVSKNTKAGIKLVAKGKRGRITRKTECVELEIIPPTDVDTNNLLDSRNNEISDVSKAEVEKTSCFLDAGATIDCKDVGSAEVSMDTLCSIIPEGELAELLETEDLLFCSNKDAEDQVANRRGRESTRRSVRRSARLQNTTHTTGSVFTEEELPILQRITDSSKPYETVCDGINEKENSCQVLTPSSTTIISSNYSDERDLRCLGAENDEVFLTNKDNVSTVYPFFKPALARLSISEATGCEPLTPAQNNSQEFFKNQIPKLKVPKKGKTKRRVDDRQSDLVAVPDLKSRASNSTDSVLKDLSNLSLEGKPNTRLKRATPGSRKHRTGGSVMKPRSNRTAEKTDKITGVNIVGLSRNVDMPNLFTNELLKSVKEASEDFHETSDESFCFSGSLASGEVGKNKRRQSLRSAGNKAQINYCEESDRSGSVSRRTSEENRKNSSLERSKRNSLLVTSGEKEIDISMPAAVRRSLTGEFVPKLNLPASTELVMIENGTKSVSSVGDAFLSDSEDEEIISGIFGKKTLLPRQYKERKKIDRGFLD